MIDSRCLQTLLCPTKCFSWYKHSRTAHQRILTIPRLSYPRCTSHYDHGRITPHCVSVCGDSINSFWNNVVNYISLLCCRSLMPDFHRPIRILTILAILIIKLMSRRCFLSNLLNQITRIQWGDYTDKQKIGEIRTKWGYIVNQAKSYAPRISVKNYAFFIFYRNHLKRT